MTEAQANKVLGLIKRFFVQTFKFIVVWMNKMKKTWNKIPDQIKRISIPIMLLIVAFFAARHFLIPSDFGKYGHYRASAVDEIASQEIKYVGHTVCEDCHDDVTDTIKMSYHRNVMCEVCHGPAAAHIDDPDGNKLPAPRERGYCPLCHEYLPPRPTGFPQIVSESHNPMRACVSCHDAHDPKPPDAPKECEACHAEIARTKALSHHVYITCTKCHETAEEHKISPRNYLPSTPSKREFCGECHAESASIVTEASKIDMATHGERYMCWQCHYPHLPEAR
jgi:ribosomal protein S27AE